MPCHCNLIEAEISPCEEEEEEEDTCAQYDAEYYDEEEEQPHLPCEEPNEEDEEEEPDWCLNNGEPESDWEPPPYLACEDRYAGYAPSRWNTTLEESDDPVDAIVKIEETEAEAEADHMATGQPGKRPWADSISDDLNDL